MAAITWDDVIALAPEVADLSVTGQGFLLDYVNTYLNVSLWGGEDSSRLRLGRIYFAAHLAAITVEGGGSAAGPVISEKVGEISRTFANASMSTATGLGSTGYGRMFQLLMRSLGPAAMVL
jgi:hypothetical protein